MKLFLAFALVAMAAALPEPVHLPAAALPVDPVRFVDSVQQDAPTAEEIQADAVKIADAPTAQEEFHVDAVRFVDSAPEDTLRVDAVKIADAPAAQEEIQVDTVRFVDSVPEDTPAAEAVQIADAVRFVDSPLSEEAGPVKVAFTPFELTRQAKEMIPEDVVFVHAPLVQFVEVSQVMPASFELQAAPLPEVKDNQVDAVRFVDNSQAVVAPLEIKPILPIDAGMIIVPPQIMDIIKVAEKIMAGKGQPDMGNIVVDPMLR